MSVYDEQFSTATADAPMRRITIPDVIAHPRRKCKSPPISQTRFQFPLKTQKHVSLCAPVIRLIPRRILDHAHANLAKFLRPPQRNSRIPGMFGYRNPTPIGYRESTGSHFHVPSIALSCNSTLQVSTTRPDSRSAAVNLARSVLFCFCAYYLGCVVRSLGCRKCFF
jgi:hypothetical protein